MILFSLLAMIGGILMLRSNAEQGGYNVKVSGTVTVIFSVILLLVTSFGCIGGIRRNNSLLNIFMILLNG
jgi:hypothetical protein